MVQWKAIFKVVKVEGNLWAMWEISNGNDGALSVIVVDVEREEKNEVEIPYNLPHWLENPQEYTPLLSNQLSVNSSHCSTEISYDHQT